MVKQQPGGNYPPITTRYVDEPSKAEVEAKVVSYEDDTMTHHSYDQEVIIGWDRLITLTGADAPVIIGALGQAMHRYHIQKDMGAIEEFTVNMENNDSHLGE